MPWSTIVSALAARLQAVCSQPPTKAAVHPYLRWSNDGPDGSAFQALFVLENRLATIQVTRTNVRHFRALEDSRQRVQHDLRAELQLALDDADQSELLHQELVDRIMADLRAGDRTLGGASLTYSDPRADLQHITNPARVLCHQAEIQFTVEEVLGTRPDPTVTALPDLGPGLRSRHLEMGIALRDWLASQTLIQGLALAQLKLDPSLRPHPRYPLDPVDDLPALFVQVHTASNARLAGNGRDSVYQFSLYYYRRQGNGEHHQLELGKALRAIETALLRAPRPYSLEVLCAQMLTPVKVDYLDELTHPLMDDPRLRVSVGEILIQIQSKEQ